MVFAAASNLLETEPGLREKTIAAGLRNLQRYERENLKQQLQQWLDQLGLSSSSDGVKT